ncbi:MAG TPA: serine hydrolase domain-containing protein [Chloroflexota bacterium]|nr:serine hydrolase domain-containing protein [Chloroflexota bacterium]
MPRDAHRFDRELLDAAFAAVEEGVRSGELPSGVLAVATAEKTVRLEAFGPVKTDSVFLLASITKPIFATAVMRLVERGRVRLNDPISKVIPEFAANGKADVRLWHLLTHTSGLDEASGLSLWGQADRAGLTAAAIQAPLRFRPGNQYAYCNASFFVMGELIRRLSGRDDVTFLQEEVLERLGMEDTSYQPPASARLAPVHGSPWPQDPHFEYLRSLCWGAAGLSSTAADLVRFGQAFLGGGALNGQRVLAPATVRAMTTLQTGEMVETRPLGDGPAHYGLGFAKAGPDNATGPSAELRTPDGFGHGGATGTALWIEPELDLVFVFLTNKWGLDAPHASRALNATIAAASTV